MSVYLYKFEIRMADRSAVLILMEESERNAMDAVDAHLSKHYIETPEVREIVLVEKRRAMKGAGYVVET